MLPTGRSLYVGQTWMLLCTLCMPAICAPGSAGAAEKLSVAHTVFVDSLGTGVNAEATRKRVVDGLEKSGVRVVDNAASADAILHGNVVIWQTGTVSANLRSNSSRQVLYQGYLSVELTDSSKRTLWSYLATPGRFRASNVVDDLADQVVARLEQEMKKSPSLCLVPWLVHSCCF